MRQPTSKPTSPPTEGDEALIGVLRLFAERGRVLRLASLLAEASVCARAEAEEPNPHSQVCNSTHTLGVGGE